MSGQPASMRRGALPRRGRGAAYLLAGAIAAGAPASLGGCNDPPANSPYLHVFFAAQQPRSSNLGVIVNLQASGGNYVSLVAAQGSVRLLTSEEGGAATASACLPVTDGEIISFAVIPSQAETLLFGNLYNEPGDKTLGGPDALCPTNDNPVATSVTPIASAVNTTTAQDSGGAAPIDAGGTTPLDATGGT